MYKLIGDLIVLAMLVYFTITDIRWERISWPIALVVGGAGVVLHLIFSQPVLACLWGVLPGLLLLLIAHFCGEAIGKGDCYALAACGAVLDFARTFELMFLSMVFAAVWAVLLLVRNRGGLKQRFAFMPFMLAAQMCLLLR